MKDRYCKFCIAACNLLGMPELPDIAAYISALELRIVGQPLQRVRLASPFLLRTVEPSLASAEGRTVRELRRIGKRIAIGLENDLWLVLHLMIAGRLHWKAPGAKLSGRNQLAAFDFPTGAVVLTEAGSKRRASLHVLVGEEGLCSVDPGGLRFSRATWRRFARRSVPKIARSRGRLPILASLAESVMRIPMKFSTPRHFHLSR